MLKILLIDDDEEQTLKLLNQYIKNYFSKTNKEYLLESSLSSKEIKNHCLHKWDVIILDIEMPDENGIEFSKRVREVNKNIKLVFITGYVNYMADSYKVHAFDFLLKPVNQQKIFDLFNELYSYYFNEDQNNSVLEFITTVGKINLPQSEIIYFEYVDKSIDSINRCTKMVTSNGQFFIKKPLNDVYNSLDSNCFCMPHRSFIINFENVKSFKKNDVYMNNEHIIPISQRKIKSVKEQFTQFVNYTFKRG